MKAIAKRLKSKTYYLGILTLFLGYAEQNLEMLKPLLNEWYGLVLFALGAAIMVVREFTYKPVNEK